MCLKQTKIMESFNIYQNTQLKNAKYANKHFLEILNTQLKFEIPITVILFGHFYPHAFLKKRRGYCNRLRPSVCPGAWGRGQKVKYH